MDKTEIRHASTVILLRHNRGDPHVLMGQRGKSAAFMPNKFVFPGGALDSSDHKISLASLPSVTCLSRLQDGTDPTLATPLLAAAIRETWEETGLILGQPGTTPTNTPPDWQGFFAHSVLPSAQSLQFIFRAVTPPARPRRFDARFFLVDAKHLHNDLDDLSNASDELSHLQWVPLGKAREFDLPFITEVVLAEVQARLDNPDHDPGVPYFHHKNERSYFRRL